ncbi:Bromodomain-containing protein [Meira miltonrushii]|uniref:Bromodomain-containing protein n=1 Tax=Meira miltonrushii TaxID=1280837 RepID=A0A316VL43_9BASI|nr:Bromodomain-containing protein [Meira miltonrushii]PWN37984.1 Bromodomain-containing protein [Meira miltonrushii]
MWIEMMERKEDVNAVSTNIHLYLHHIAQPWHQTIIQTVSMPPRSSIPGLSTGNIIEGGRKRGRNDDEAPQAQASPRLGSSPALRSSGATPIPDSTSKEKVTQQGFRLLDFIIHRLDTSDKSPLCIPFLALPSRTDYPDYYEQIKTPLSLEQVRRKLQNRQYDSLEDVRNALETIWRNAKRYNLKTSEIYEKARVLHSATRESYVDLAEKNELAPVYDGGLQEGKPSLMEQSARLAKIEKPNARARLDYDEPTRGPPTVSLRLKKSDDIDYEEDSDTVPGESQSPAPTMAVNTAQAPVHVKREQSVKEEDTQMTDVAPVTTRASTAAKAEQSQPTTTAAPAVSIAQSNGTTANSPAPVASTSHAPAPSFTPTQSSGSKKRRIYAPRGKRLKSTLRQLVSSLKFKEYKPSKTMCEDFMDLPTKAELPEYYKEIKEPISMRMIDEKSMRNGYETAFSLFSDLRLMVKNAKEFNEEGSDIWKNADAISQHIENIMVPALLAENFTLHPEDDRESVLPGDVFDPVAHAAAKAAELESSDESPEPNASGGGGGKRGRPSNQSLNHPNVHPNNNANWQEYARANGYLAPNAMQAANSPEAMRAQANQRRMPNGQPMLAGYPPNAMSPPLPGGYPAGYPGASPFSGPPAVNGVSQHAPPKNTKRLNGEAPPDPYDIATLLLPDGTKWRRKSVCSAFTVAYRGVDGRDRDVIFANDVSHNHAVGVGSFYNSRAGENATVSITFSVKKIVPVDNGKKTTEEDEMLQRPWSVTAHYNGTSTKIQSADGEEANVVDGATEVGQGANCSILLKPTSGNSVLDVSISPSAPDATLSAIVADPKHPHHARASALLALPDKYRIFLNCE